MKEVSEKKTSKYYLIYKIPMLILIISYLIYFIYEYISKDYDINKKENIINIGLIFLSIFLLGLAIVTNNKISLVFTVTNYVVILFLIVPIVLAVLPKHEKNSTASKIVEDEKITCTGSTDTSDETQIDIDYNGDRINKIVYTYIFNIDKKDGAENLVNRFDKKYNDIDNIYSEITISDNVVVTFTYKLENVDQNKLKEIDEDIETSFKKLKETQLNNLTCKNRGN